MTTTWIQPLQTGKLVFQIIGAVAEFEKDIIRERVVAGLENAKQKGKQLGRPKIHELGVGEGTIRKTIKKEQPRNM
jgi:DNA invertase Pin-like site-specific DNA recombinase